MEAIDLTDPQHPVSVAQYRGGDLFPSREIILHGEPRYDNGHDLVYRDGCLYVTAQNASRFGILKVNNERVLDLTKRVGRMMVCPNILGAPAARFATGRFRVACSFRKS